MAVSLRKYDYSFVPLSAYSTRSKSGHSYLVDRRYRRRSANKITQKVMKSFGFIPSIEAFRKTNSGRNRKMLTYQNAKIVKGEKKGYKSAILNFMPYKSSGFNVCPWAGHCAKECLDTAGRNVFYSAQKARAARTMLFKFDEHMFMMMLIHEIIAFTLANQLDGYQTSIRLNGLSDIDWTAYLHFEEMVNDFTDSDGVRWLNFHDYTKNPFMKSTDYYHRTYSINEKTEIAILKMLLREGTSACMVVAGQSNKRKDAELAKQEMLTYGFEYKGFQLNPDMLFDADETDLRFLDEPSKVGLLTAKGKALEDKTSGFVHIL